MFVMWLEIGRMLRRSSMATQFLQDASERMNLKSSETVWQVDDMGSAAPTLLRGSHLSLKRPTTS